MIAICSAAQPVTGGASAYRRWVALVLRFSKQSVSEGARANPALRLSSIPLHHPAVSNELTTANRKL